MGLLLGVGLSRQRRVHATGAIEIERSPLGEGPRTKWAGALFPVSFRRCPLTTKARRARVACRGGGELISYPFTTDAQKIRSARQPRSHAPRGNAVCDAPRPSR